MAKDTFKVNRTGVASLLFAVLRPRDARSVAVNDNLVRVTFAFRSRDISIGDLIDVSVKNQLRWASVSLRHAGGEVTVSGLDQDDAQALGDSLENARTRWWRRTLEPQTGMLRSVHECLAQLADPPNYVRIADIRDLTRDAKSTAAGLVGQWPSSLANTPEIRMLKDILDFLEAPDRAREKANKARIANELSRSRTLFDTIEAMPLTEEQRHAVVLDDHRNLVVAAAGSGKTSVIVAKAGWLIKRGYRRPSELLLLAFARDARQEMRQRIRNRLGPAAARGVTVRTFHSLGLSIIGQAEGRRPALAPSAESAQALFELLKGIVADLLADGGLSGTLLEWFRDQFAPYKSEHEFRNWGEYWNYIRRHDIRSLKGEKVKSYEECEIANYLYLNGIAYEYEAAYEHDTATPDKRQYQPDFHLPDHGIYIEHFGLDAEGKTAPFVDNDKYRREMEWKRRVHEEHGTALIETFSHEHSDGNLLRNLAKKLGAHDVVLAPIPRDDLFGVLEQQGRIDPFTRLLVTFLQHFKGSRRSFAEIARRASSLAGRKRAEAFLAVFRPVFERYQESLARAGTIDFHDMINRATDLVESGRYRSPFGYIMVDEFQDISPARARLLKALLDSAPNAQLFAVGDDWQAIYRFGGSDIAVMREFETWFGDYMRIDLETMFRTDDRIAKVATDFVLCNPAQIRKTVRPMRKSDRPAVHLGLPERKGISLLMEALDKIAEDAGRHDGTSSVLLLGRYRHLRPRNMGRLAQRYPGLRFTYRTVHRSKGLEADYAVVLGLCSGKHGFPSEITDDPLLDLVLAAPEAHPNAEERRLLYVAITRARRQVYLLAEGGPPSSFARELLHGRYDLKVFGRLPQADAPCPQCKEGRLERRENPRSGSTFFGCSNWPYCSLTRPPCPNCGIGLTERKGDHHRCRDCGELLEPCPDCDGWMETRMGQYGRFLGCSNWPDCSYTRNLRYAQEGHENRRRRRDRGQSRRTD